MNTELAKRIAKLSNTYEMTACWMPRMSEPQALVYVAQYAMPPIGPGAAPGKNTGLRRGQQAALGRLLYPNRPWAHLMVYQFYAGHRHIPDHAVNACHKAVRANIPHIRQQGPTARHMLHMCQGLLDWFKLHPKGFESTH